MWPFKKEPKCPGRFAIFETYWTLTGVKYSAKSTCDLCGKTIGEH